MIPHDFKRPLVSPRSVGGIFHRSIKGLLYLAAMFAVLLPFIVSLAFMLGVLPK